MKTLRNPVLMNLQRYRVNRRWTPTFICLDSNCCIHLSALKMMAKPVLLPESSTAHRLQPLPLGSSNSSLPALTRLAAAPQLPPGGAPITFPHGYFPRKGEGSTARHASSQQCDAKNANANLDPRRAASWTFGCLRDQNQTPPRG